MSLRCDCCAYSMFNHIETHLYTVDSDKKTFLNGKRNQKTDKMLINFMFVHNK